MRINLDDPGQLFLMIFVAGLLSQFVAYIGNVALRLVMVHYQEWKLARAYAVIRACPCGKRFDIRGMHEHLRSEHKEFEIDQVRDIMLKFRKENT
jgi:hypothetical protein